MNLSNWFYPTGVLFEISVPTFLLWGAFQGHTILVTQQLENHFHSWRNVYKVHCEKSNKLCSKRDLLSSLIVVKHRVTFRAIFNSFNFPSLFWMTMRLLYCSMWLVKKLKHDLFNQSDAQWKQFVPKSLAISRASGTPRFAQRILSLFQNFQNCSFWVKSGCRCLLSKASRNDAVFSKTYRKEHSFSPWKIVHCVYRRCFWSTGEEIGENPR